MAGPKPSWLARDKAKKWWTMASGIPEEGLGLAQHEDDG